MEEQFSLFQVCTSFILIFSMFLWISKKSTSKRSSENLPPGPWRLPVIGNMHQLIGSLPHRRLRDLARRYGPVMHLQIGEISHVVVSSPEAAKVVLRTHDIIFASRPYILAIAVVLYGPSDIAFAPYGDYWRQMRKISVLELFSAKRIQSYRQIREEEVSNMVRSISSNAGLPINMSLMLSTLANCVTSRAVSGKLHEQRGAFLPFVQKLKPLVAGFNVVDFFPSIPLLDAISGMRTKIERLRQDGDIILESIINEHKARITTTKDNSKDEPDCLIDVLLKIQEHGELEFPVTTDNIKGVILELFLAGSDTTSTVIEWAMAELLKNPSVMEKAQAEVGKLFSKKKIIDENSVRELNYLSLVIKETLRLHPPFTLLVPRESREEAEINGYKIPAKTRVLVNAWTIGRDPCYWTEPELFNPERFLDTSFDYKGANFEYIPFGSGRRVCPGALYALAIVELSLANLLYHFDCKLPDGENSETMDMTEADGLGTRRKNDLYVIPIPYTPS